MDSRELTKQIKLARIARDYGETEEERAAAVAAVVALERQRSALYMRNYTADAEKRAKINARNKQYYHKNKEVISGKNKERRTQKKEPEENGAFKSPEDAQDIILDELVKYLG